MERRISPRKEKKLKPEGLAIRMPCSIPSPPPRSRTHLHVHNAHPDYNSNQEADLLSKVERPSKSRMHLETEYPFKSVSLVHPQLNGGQGEIQNLNVTLSRYPTKEERI